MLRIKFKSRGTAINKMTTETATHEETRSRLDSVLNDFVKNELHKNKKGSGDISPLQMREWDNAVGTLAHLIRQIIRQNEEIGGEE